jgi:hypothetical protein
MAAEKAIAFPNASNDGEKVCQTEVINYKKVNTGKALKEMSGDRNLRINILRLSYFSTKKG